MSDVIHTDKQGHGLTHYVMAERCIQTEYSAIMKDLNYGPTSETLIYILEGGFKGFHKMSEEELIAEYMEVEDKWYQIHEDQLFHWEVYEKDPINKQKEEA
tara:strand:+ start:311 stop:613 length:303 start_codon:yes stop_codon:yes gene_type:complete